MPSPRAAAQSIDVIIESASTIATFHHVYMVAKTRGDATRAMHHHNFSYHFGRLTYNSFNRGLRASRGVTSKNIAQHDIDTPGLTSLQHAASRSRRHECLPLVTIKFSGTHAYNFMR